MKYLFVGAHTDDIELCCGGTVAKLAGQGHKVKCLVFSHLNDGQLFKECQAALNGLDVSWIFQERFEGRTLHEHRQTICQMLIDRAQGMDYVFTHSKLDVHPDHSTIGFESERALKTVNLLTYCAPWNHPKEGFGKDYFEVIPNGYAEMKIKACSQYASQQHRPYMNRDYLYSEMRVAGIQCGSVFAEGFRTVKTINR